MFLIDVTFPLVLLAQELFDLQAVIWQSSAIQYTQQSVHRLSAIPPIMSFNCTATDDLRDMPLKGE
jgi:hypothetical protein